MALKTKNKNKNNGISNYRDLWGVVGQIRERVARLEAEMAIGLFVLLGILLKLLFG